MNHIYRVVFNHQTGTFQAVSEIAKTPHKTGKTKSAKLFKALLTPISLALSLAFGLSAHASPKDGQVTAGVATIHQNGLITDINQTSQNAAINWQSFNIAHNETVNFNQPNAGAVTLNRVIGNEKSVIDGAMNANGKVFISNANGMLIGKDAQINVGSLVATTANISDDDLMNGRYQFTGGQGSIENLGQISVPKGGVVALVAPIVKNGGKITAHEGNVLLASAENFSISLPDNANFKYTLDKGTLQGLVDNGGAILADGGRVVLTAQGVDTVKKSLIKHTGAIQANTVQNKNGVIELLGDLDNSALTVSGSLKAEAKESGDGGFIETSANKVTIDKQAIISTNADNGKTGTWVLDPADFVVAKTGGDLTGAEVSQRLNSTNIQLHTINSNDGSNKNGKGDIIINDEINWNKNTLTLKAHNDIHINANLNGTGTAKLALEYGQDIDNGSTSDYYVKNGARVNLPEGNNLTIKKGSMGQTEQFQVIHTLPTKANNYTFSHQNIAIGKHIDLSNTKSLSDFKGFNVKFDNSKIHGLGNGFSGLSIDNNDDYIGLIRKMSGGEIRDLSVVNTNVRGGDKTGALIGLANGSKIQNITVIGNVQGSNFVGGIVGDATSSKLDGLKFINGSITGSNYVGGIAGYTHNISNTIVKDSKITGTDFVGGLVGYNSGNINDSATQTLTIKGNDYVGGLVGNTTGDQVQKSYTHDSHITGNNKVGGLIGSSENASKSYIKEVYFSNGTVTGKNNVGGLSGYDIDDIFNAYVSGTVTGENQVGGLVGDGLGYMNVRNAYFNGTINGTGKNVSNLFGVETYNYTYDKNYYNIDKTRPLGKYGQGKTLEQMKQKSTYEGWDFDTLWKIDNGKDTPRLQNIINHENLGVSAATSINQAYWNNIPNKPSTISYNYKMPCHSFQECKEKGIEWWKDKKNQYDEHIEKLLAEDKREEVFYLENPSINQIDFHNYIDEMYKASQNPQYISDQYLSGFPKDLTVSVSSDLTLHEYLSKVIQYHHLENLQTRHNSELNRFAGNHVNGTLLGDTVNGVLSKMIDEQNQAGNFPKKQVDWLQAGEDAFMDSVYMFSDVGQFAVNGAQLVSHVMPTNIRGIMSTLNTSASTARVVQKAPQMINATNEMLRLIIEAQSTSEDVDVDRLIDMSSSLIEIIQNDTSGLFKFGQAANSFRKLTETRKSIEEMRNAMNMIRNIPDSVLPPDFKNSVLSNIDTQMHLAILDNMENLLGVISAIPGVGIGKDAIATMSAGAKAFANAENRRLVNFYQENIRKINHANPHNQRALFYRAEAVRTMINPKMDFIK